ncbi:MAG: arylesterase [Proteobacteria bacterium]|nr:arylesterase [Pseudomonadota bacterium]
MTMTIARFKSTGCLLVWVFFLLSANKDSTKTAPLASKIASKKEPLTVVLLGDSLTAGYGVSASQAYPAVAEQMLKEKGYHLKWINGSISGSTSASGLSRLKWQLKGKPSYVLLALGSNDGLRGFPLSTVEKNIEDMIKETKKHGAVPLLVGLQVPPNLGPKYTQGFQKIFPQLALKHKIPLWDFILKDVGGESSKNLPDGIHPNAKGHRIIAQYFVTFLMNHLPSPQPS